MKITYRDLIEQTFEFPQEGFDVQDEELLFNGIKVMDIIEQYGTPLKITYLPKISQQIQKAKIAFNVAIAKANYKGSYTYTYCTKSSHFSFIMEEILKNDVHLETSSAYDISIIRALHEQGMFDKKTMIICNGFKRENYAKEIADLINDGFENVIPVLDNINELQHYENLVDKGKKVKLAMRMATEEEPNFEFYTSRLGISQKYICDFYTQHIANNPKFELTMLHFFINTGIKDTTYYWSELNKLVHIYCELKKICPTLHSLDIGGGFPIRTSLAFAYDYEFMAEQIVGNIKLICQSSNVEEPNLITEFGSFTVGESGAVFYSVVDMKNQNESEKWYMIDSSFITTLPDTWGIDQRFILMAINKWGHEYQRVNLGGITCDSEDYYNAESHLNLIFLPKNDEKDEEPLYIGFFHTGAYQESLGGYGGIQHCLIPAPKHVLIGVDENGETFTRLFAKEQSAKSMLKILGY